MLLQASRTKNKKSADRAHDPWEEQKACCHRFGAFFRNIRIPP
jgi:hypothetical protein